MHKCNRILKHLPLNPRWVKLNTCHHSLEYAKEKSISINSTLLSSERTCRVLNLQGQQSGRLISGAYAAFRVFHEDLETWTRQLTLQDSKPEMSPLVFLKAQSCSRRTGSAQRLHQGKTEEEAKRDRRLKSPSHGIYVWSMRRSSPCSANIRERWALKVKPLCLCTPSQLPDLLAVYPGPNFSTYSLTNKPFKQSIPILTTIQFSCAALHPRR